MKKNTMMRVASTLLVAVLLTTCAISGTFAKYTSTYEGTATASVAKWAFNMNGEAIAQDFTFDLVSTVTETDGSEETEVRDGFIAPGTKGSFKIELDNNSDVVAAYDVAVEYTGAIPITFNAVYPTDNQQIALGGSATITVNWEWAFGENVDDTPHAGTNLEATVTITLTQLN